jgi:hypothetical protein
MNVRHWLCVPACANSRVQGWRTIFGVHGKVPRLELFGTNSGKIWQGIPEISERILGILGLDQGGRGPGGLRASCFGSGGGSSGSGSSGGKRDIPCFFLGF